MSVILKDGTGTGRTARVTADNRVATHAISMPINIISAINDDAFDVSSTILELTSANESAILYLQNSEEDDIVATVQFVDLCSSTGGSGEATAKLYYNPTGGTIISDANDAELNNRRVGSAVTMTANYYKGGEGKTATGGSAVSFPLIVPTNSAFGDPIVIPSGKAIALSVIPPTGNTSMCVQIGLYVVRNLERYSGE